MPPVREITAEGQAARDRIAQNRAMRDSGLSAKEARVQMRNIEPTISANDLATPVETINPPMETPPEQSDRVGSLIGNVTRDTQGFITNQSEEAQRAREIAGEMASLSGQSSGDVRSSLNEEFQIPQNLQQLRDIQLQLADRGTETNIQNTRIGQGNSIAQGNREITQNDREAAIRDAGLAARASVLQGNIETATTLVSQAVQDFNADRTFKNNQMINQLNYFQGLADSQTSQLLEQEKRKYQEDQAAIERVQGAVDAAMASGAASQQDITQLTDPRLTDEERLAVAQGVVARGAGQVRELDMAAKRAGIASTYASIDLAERKFNYQQQQDALNVELEMLQNQGVITEEQAAQTQKVESALRLKDLVEQVRGHAGFNLSVGSVGSRVVSLTEGGLVGQAYNYLSGQGQGFDALYDQLTESLTLDNLDKMTGVLTDRDIQVLRSAATRLRKTTTEAEFLNTLDEMDSIFQRTIDENGISPQQARFYYGVDDQTLGEIDSIFGTESTSQTTIGTNFDF